MDSYDVVVIGAGIVGSMIARELSRYGLRLALIEKEGFPGFGATKANPCMLHSPLMFPSGPLRVGLCVNAAARYRSLAAELAVDFKVVDELFVALDGAQLEKLTRAKTWAEDNGLAAGHRLIGAEELRRIEPNVSERAIGALYGKGLSGALYAPEWAFALADSAAENGTRLLFDSRVTGLSREGEKLIRVDTTTGSLSARYVVNAAGLYADDIAHMAGDRDIELVLTKAVMAITDKAASSRVNSMVYGTYDREHSQMVTPTVHGNLLLGLGRFTSPHSKTDTAVAPGKLGELLSMCRELVPAISPSDIITSFAGIRSENTTAHGGDFYIAPSEHMQGVIHAVVGSPGVTAAPAIAEYVVGLLAAAGLRLVPDDNFCPRRKGWPRFESASAKKRQSEMARNAAFGHIICRCEHVSEAEIAEAVGRGARSLDALKHVTRAGMGRCQGAFCGTTLITYLSEHLGIAPTEVTKRGGPSQLITGLTRSTE